MCLHPSCMIYALTQNLDSDINPITPIQPWTVFFFNSTVSLEHLGPRMHTRKEEDKMDDKTNSSSDHPSPFGSMSTEVVAGIRSNMRIIFLRYWLPL